jgi:signal transduction histidine kinase
MNLNEIIGFNTQIIYLALSIVAILRYAHRPSPRRRDFALMAASLGFPFGITLLRNLQLLQSGLLDLVGAFVLFSQPYFLFRLLQYFRPSRRGIGILILAGFPLSCALIWFRMGSNPALTVSLIFSYCAAAEAYSTWGFYRGMRATNATLRLRLRIITISSAIFTLAFIMNVIKAQLPGLDPNITPLAQAAAAVSAVFFYIAFVPPRWLRRAWQMEELRTYLSQTSPVSASASFVTDSFQQLSAAANQATNGIGSAVLHVNQSTRQWSVLTATNPALFARLLEHGQLLLNDAWQQGRPVCRFISEIEDSDERRRLGTLDASTWLFVPVQSQTEKRGLLTVALRVRSLFVDDDLGTLQLLAHECALILDNHRLIDELQDYSDRLERKVEARTAALKRSNDELRRFAYIASHDLQEPLRTVTSYLQLIEQRFPERLDDEGREFIAYAVEGALRMKNLIHDLLAYSRVEYRTRNFSLIDMQRVLDNTRKLLDATIAEVDARITYDPLPQIVADEELMLQVFQNLVSNAMKYRSTRKPEIHISANYQDQHWVFSVRDNGIGIEQEFLDRIFVIFQRLHTSEQYPGTGIGLAICKKAVELHDGRIWVESQAGQGTTFHFSIPVHDVRDLAESA